MRSYYDKILKKVDDYISHHSLLKKNDRVCVALSGGSDSVFLLYALLELKDKYNLEILAGHLNHSLRDEADSEEEFCKKLCKDLGVLIYTRKVDVLAISEREKISTETAGRNARYEFFADLKNEVGGFWLATAHHKDDNAETILMHFIRGSALKGLSGIEPKRADGVIRPLLDVTKAEILGALEDKNIPFVTDLSNFSDIYRRNKLRLSLIPQILEYNPNFSDVISKNGALILDDENFISEYAKNIFYENFKEGKLEFFKISNEHISVKRRLIQLLYKEATKKSENLSSLYIDEILKLKGNKKINLPNGFSAVLEYGRLEIKKQKKAGAYEYSLFPDIPLYIEEFGKWAVVKKTDKRDKNTFYIDNDGSFLLRTRKRGDYFYPVGMSGKKTVSDLFTDKKVQKDLRDTLPLLTFGGEIVNIGGVWRDRRFYEEEKKYAYTFLIY